MRKLTYAIIDIAIVLTAYSCYSPNYIDMYDLPFLVGIFILMNDYLCYVRHRIQNENAVHRRIGVYSDPNWQHYAQNRLTIEGKLHPRLVGFELAVLSAFMSPIVPMYSAIEKVAQNGCIQAREAFYVLILSAAYAILVIIRIFTVIKPSYTDAHKLNKRRVRRNRRA